MCRALLFKQLAYDVNCFILGVCYRVNPITQNKEQKEISILIFVKYNDNRDEMTLFCLYCHDYSPPENDYIINM